MKNIVFLFAVLLFSFISCKKDEEPVPEFREPFSNEFSGYEGQQIDSCRRMDLDSCEAVAHNFFVKCYAKVNGQEYIVSVLCKKITVVDGKERTYMPSPDTVHFFPIKWKKEGINISPNSDSEVWVERWGWGNYW